MAAKVTSTRVLHGDLLRCICEYLKSHCEMFKFALVNHDLHTQINKQITGSHSDKHAAASLTSSTSITNLSFFSRLPHHLRHYQYRTVAGFIGLLASPSGRLLAATALTSLDLSDMSIADADECFPLDKLLRPIFPSLTSLHCRHHHPEHPSISNPYESVRIDDIHDYRSYLIDLIKRHCRIEKLTQLLIQVDSHSEIEKILCAIKNLTSLQVDVHLSSQFMDGRKQHRYIDALNPSNCPHLRQLTLNFDTHCRFPIAFAIDCQQSSQRAAQQYQSIQKSFVGTSTLIYIRGMILHAPRESRAHPEQMMRIMRSLTQDDITKEGDELFPYVPQTSSIITRMQIDLRQPDQRPLFPSDSYDIVAEQHELMTHFDLLCQMQITMHQQPPPTLTLQCDIIYDQSASSISEWISNEVSLSIDEDGISLISLTAVLSRCTRLELVYSVTDWTGSFSDPFPLPPAFDAFYSSSSTCTHEELSSIRSSLCELLTADVMPHLNEIHLSASNRTWRKPPDLDEDDRITNEIADAIRQHLRGKRGEGESERDGDLRCVRVITHLNSDPTFRVTYLD